MKRIKKFAASVKTYQICPVIIFNTCTYESRNSIRYTRKICILLQTVTGRLDMRLLSIVGMLYDSLQDHSPCPPNVTATHISLNCQIFYMFQQTLHFSSFLSLSLSFSPFERLLFSYHFYIL